MSPDFLDIITSSEAINKGVNLDEKNKHAVYTAILDLSTQSAARNGGLFNANVKNAELAAINKPEFLKILRGLITDRLVGQLFYLTFKPPGLGVIPCYFANAGKEPLLIEKIYDDVVGYSVAEAEKLLSAYKPAAPRMLKEDLEKDFNTPATGQLALQYSLVDLFENVELDQFDIFPPSRVINHILEQVTRQLIEDKKVVRLPNSGLVPLHDDELLMRFQLAEDILTQRLVPLYKKKTSCRRYFEQITLEEAAHYLEKIVPYTAAFSRRRAEVIERENRDKVVAGKNRYPGILAVETILALAPMAEEKFQKQWEDKNKRRFAEIKQNLLSDARPWQDLILFVRDEELDAIPRQIWRWLTEDRDLVYSIWYREEEREHILLKRDVGTIQKLIEGMYENPPEKTWQILALRTVIDQAEDDLQQVFENQALVKKYGRLLRLAYNNYIPWYYKLFFLMSLKFIQDMAFPIAKEKIRLEQVSNSRRNEQRIYDLTMEGKREKEKKMARIRQVANKNAIIEKLDQFYLVEHEIPGEQMVAESLPDIADETFKETVKNAHFQVIRDPAGQGKYQNILLYPIDVDWPVVANRLLNSIDGWLTVMQAKKNDGKSNNMVARAKLVKSHIERKKNARLPKVDEDPYQKLEEAIKAHEQWKMKTNFGRGLARN